MVQASFPSVSLSPSLPPSLPPSPFPFPSPSSLFLLHIHNPLHRTHLIKSAFGKWRVGICSKKGFCGHLARPCFQFLVIITLGIAILLGWAMTVHVQWTQNRMADTDFNFSYVYMLFHHAVQGILNTIYTVCSTDTWYFMLLAACCRRVLCFKQEDRLETEGTPVPVSRLSSHLTATCSVFMFSSIPCPSWPPPPPTLSPCRPTSMCFSTTARLTNTWQHTQSGHTGIGHDRIHQ